MTNSHVYPAGSHVGVYVVATVYGFLRSDCSVREQWLSVVTVMYKSAEGIASICCNTLSDTLQLDTLQEAMW